MSNWVKKTAKMNRTLAFLKTKSAPGGYTWEFVVGQCRHVLQCLTLFHTKNVIFHIRFQTPPLKSIPILRPGLYEIMSSLLRLEQQQKRFLKIHFEFAYLSLFRIETIALPQFPRKPNPIPDQNEQSLYPFSDQNCAKSLLFGEAPSSETQGQLVGSIKCSR